MFLIAQQQLKRMLAWRELQHRLHLALVEMKMIRVSRYWLIKTGNFLDIDQQVMVTGRMPFLAFCTGRRDAKSFNAEFHFKGAFDHCAVFQVNEVHLRIIGRRMS